MKLIVIVMMAMILTNCTVRFCECNSPLDDSTQVDGNSSSIELKIR